MTSYDPNLDYLYRWARSCSNKPILPGTLYDVTTRAKFLDFVDKVLIAGTQTSTLNSNELDSFRGNLELKTSTSLHDVQQPIDRFVITAVLWTGCMDGAKTIRDTKVLGITPDGRAIEGPITDQERLDGSIKIESLAATDSLYRYGVETSPILRKIIRNQPIFINGIPPDSMLMQTLKPYL